MEAIEIFVDGGCKSNGRPDSAAYGSYAVKYQGQIRRSEWFDLPDCVTNNEAEYGALIAGLEYLQGLLARAPQVGQRVALVKTDSQLVYGQVAAGWKVKAANLLPRQRAAASVLEGLHRKGLIVRLVKVGREEIVTVLGH